MNILSLVVFLFYTAKTAVADSTVSEQLDLKDIERNDILWMNLFSRINTILNETTKLSEGQIILNKRLDEQELKSNEFMEKVQNNTADLNKRLDVQELKSTELLETVQNNTADVNKSLAAHDLKSTGFMERIQNNTTDLGKRLDVQDLKSTELMESLQNHTEASKKSQDELERKLSEFMEKAEAHYSDVKKRQEAEELLSQQKYNPVKKLTTILRRQDGSVDFYRNWTEYRNGFGHPDGEFFIGLERLHAMTSSGVQQELIVILRNFKNEERFAKYDLFRIGNEAEKYAIKELGTYSGDGGDSLSRHKGMKFTTYDEDNDTYSGNCAKELKGAWWFADCRDSHLFGPYKSENKSNEDGLSWYYFGKSYRSLKFAEMKIRPKIY